MAEYTVEIICSTGHIHTAITGLKNSHPDEKPAVQVIRCKGF